MSRQYIKDFKYKKLSGIIYFCMGDDRGADKNKFIFDGDMPFTGRSYKTLEDLEKSLKEKYNEWIARQPKK